MRTLFLCMSIAALITASGCRQKRNENQDQVYSRHLQKQMQLTVLSTKPPKDRGTFNLVLLNNSALLNQWNVRKMLDSLNQNKVIQPIIIVGIHPVDEIRQFDVAGMKEDNNDGAYAEKFQNFILNELLPFIKKKAEVRKFQTVSIVGADKGGVSVMDLAWNNWDKFDHVAVFTSHPASAATSMTLLKNKIQSSRKRPKLHFWIQDILPASNTDSSEDHSLKPMVDLLIKKGIAGGNIQYFPVKNAGNNSGINSNSFAQFLANEAGKK